MTDCWCPQTVQTHRCRQVSAPARSPPQRGHEKPSGQREANKYARQAASLRSAPGAPRSSEGKWGASPREATKPPPMEPTGYAPRDQFRRRFFRYGPHRWELGWTPRTCRAARTRYRDRSGRALACALYVRILGPHRGGRRPGITTNPVPVTARVSRTRPCPRGRRDAASQRRPRGDTRRVPRVRRLDAAIGTL